MTRRLFTFTLTLLFVLLELMSASGCKEEAPARGDAGVHDGIVTTDAPLHDGAAPVDTKPGADSTALADGHATLDGASDTVGKQDTTTFPCPIVTDQKQKTVPTVPKPAYLGSFIDPVFGHKVIRVTGDPGTTIPVVGGTWGTVERHHYSKDMAWNADMTLLLIDKSNGSHPDLFLDGKTYKVLFAKNGPGSARWHPLTPSLRIYVTGSEIGTWDVHSGTKSVSSTFSGYSELQFGPYEGNPSADGGRVAVLAKNPSAKQVAFAYDLKLKKKYPDIDLQGHSVDWVSISRLGKYVVFNGDGDTTQVYDLQGNKVGPTWSEYGRPSHYDLTVDDQGDEVAVGVSKSKPDQGRMIKRRLSDGKVTILTPSGWVSHTSARNIARPGWAYGTYATPSSSWQPYYAEIVAAKLDGSLTVQRLVHTHAAPNGYLTEAHGSPSPDGKKVIWASNWDDPNGAINAYVVEICGGP
jgi:hypothetical protein